MHVPLTRSLSPAKSRYIQRQPSDLVPKLDIGVHRLVDLALRGIAAYSHRSECLGFETFVAVAGESADPSA